jgi:hypothetical protein
LDNLVIAVDPGGTYGIAVGHLDNFLHDVSAQELLPFEALSMVESMLPRAEYVFCESWTPRPGIRTNQPDALEGIGALRYMTSKANVKFVLQSPANAKRFSTNEKLTRLGWRTITRGGHADDALRHLLLGAVRHGLIGGEDLL